MREREVFYVSYGSNMSRTRLLCYIYGGRPDGGNVVHLGTRVQTPPAEDIPVELPGRLYFAGESRTWTGGMAFYDHAGSGPTAARAYRITVSQFVDIAAAEMHREPDPDDPLEKAILTGLPGGRHTAGPGLYETTIQVGERDGLPMLTFTAAHGSADVAHTVPTDRYLAMLADGLADAHGWVPARIDAYFAQAKT